MDRQGIDALLNSASIFLANHQGLNSPKGTSARYFAERSRDELLNTAVMETEQARKQHEMLRAGLCSIYNRLRDRDEFGHSYHFSSLTDIEWALESLIQRYEDSFNEED